MTRHDVVVPEVTASEVLVTSTIVLTTSPRQIRGIRRASVTSSRGSPHRISPPPPQVDPDHTALVTVEGAGERGGREQQDPGARRRGRRRWCARADRRPVPGGTRRGCAEIVLHRRIPTRPAASNHNVRASFKSLSRRPGPPSPGSHAFDVHPDVGVEPTDFVLPRPTVCQAWVGLRSTRSCATSAGPRSHTLGVSRNVALLTLTFDAVNLGYQLVLARDATAGVKRRVRGAVYANTLSLLATVTTARRARRGGASRTARASEFATVL